MIGTEKQNLKIHKSFSLTNSAIDQNAELHTEFDALYDYFQTSVHRRKLWLSNILHRMLH